MEEYIKQKEIDMLKLLETLVNIDSGSNYKQGVDAVGHIITKLFSEIGFNMQKIENKEYGNHYVLTHHRCDQPEIIILAHLDTVFPMGTALDRPFSIIDGRAYGPGVADMKGSLVTLYFAMKALQRNHGNELSNVKIILNSDEEIGSPTSRELIEKESKNARYSLVMEPARKDGSIVSSRRGKGNYTLTIEGKAAHSGIEPEKGRSAIEELAHKIIQFYQLSDPEHGISVNVGVIEGGTSPNTIPDHAEATIDIRVKDASQAEELEEKMEEIVSSTEVKGTSIVFEGEMNRPPMEKTKKTQSLIRVIQEIGDKIGVEIVDTATGGGSDASFTAALGIATVDGLGPIGGNAHSDKEYIEIDSLVERTHLLAMIIKQLTLKKVKE
ncbi:carboxypeptidase [Bacillus coahuilensis p1.1.43]|uniref:Carboxypeptidase n=3 Tax=Bacillus coahuilensis TaxID=408580 RepID=A0A147K983_9BACI|nr:M20 family metallopeptidase [Bacillus coahuilensis]KUP06904.1 carboxypeptidase [Bacillus coahuilensis p1.1.43]